MCLPLAFCSHLCAVGVTWQPGAPDAVRCVCQPEPVYDVRCRWDPMPSPPQEGPDAVPDAVPAHVLLQARGAAALQRLDQQQGRQAARTALRQVVRSLSSRGSGPRCTPVQCRAIADHQPGALALSPSHLHRPVGLPPPLCGREPSKDPEPPPGMGPLWFSTHLFKPEALCSLVCGPRCCCACV